MSVKIINPISNMIKIAGFDFDWTLICPKSSNTFCLNKDDWKFLYEDVEDVLTKYYKDGYYIVIVTYQSRDYKIEMLNNFVKKFEFPICVIIGDKTSKKDFDISEWIHAKIDYENSFYCGDADGEKGSWSDMDRVFAARNNLKFYNPSEIFGKDRPDATFEFSSNIDIYSINEYDVVIMCGSPGSGKSTFVKNYAKEFEVISSDAFKSNTNKMKKLFKELISENKKIVVDSCNATNKNRMNWIDLLHGKSYVIVYLDVDKKVAIDRNSKRQNNKVPMMAIHRWYLNFEYEGIRKNDIIIKQV